MTPKEKLYTKIIDTRNEERTVLGLAAIDKEKTLADGYARNHTMTELENELAMAQRQLAATKKKAEIAAYFKTPAGIELKNRLEKKIDDAKAMMLKAQMDMAIDLRDFTMNHLGYRWVIRNFNNRYLTIDFNDKDGKPIINKDIDVYYAVDGSNPDTFTINYPSSSEFDPTAESDYHEYIKGIFIITKQNVALEFKKMLKDYSRFYETYNDEIYNLQQQLQNPPING